MVKCGAAQQVGRCSSRDTVAMNITAAKWPYQHRDCINVEIRGGILHSRQIRHTASLIHGFRPILLALLAFLLPRDIPCRLFLFPVCHVSHFEVPLRDGTLGCKSLELLLQFTRLPSLGFPSPCRAGNKLDGFLVILQEIKMRRVALSEGPAPIAIPACCSYRCCGTQQRVCRWTTNKTQLELDN